MSNSAYTPISCALHSEYELAIMHKKHLQLSWKQHGSIHHALLLPIDLLTRNHAEFLLAQNEDGEEIEIRLDTILDR